MPGELAVDAIEAVAAHIDVDDIPDVNAQDLLTFTDPRGEGEFVYVTLMRFQGMKRYALWLVVENQAFPLNTLAKLVTPALPWPREAEFGLWDDTGQSLYGEEVTEMLFGSS